MPKSSFFMYPRNDDDYGFGWDINFDWKMGLTMDSWYGRLLKGVYNFIICVLQRLYSILGFYIMWILLHYGAAHLYPMYCMPLTMMGLLLSPFMTSAPHCIALRWLMTEGSNVIITMWAVLGAYAVQLMLRR